MASRRNIRYEPDTPNADKILKRMRKAYRTESLSPTAVLEQIADFQDTNLFRTYALILAEQFMGAGKLQEFDRIMNGPRNVDLTQKERWVANTRAVTENAVTAKVVAFMVEEVRRHLGKAELADEVMSILREPWEKIVQQRKADQERVQLQQSAVANLPGFPAPGGAISGPVYGPQPQQQPVTRRRTP